MSSDSERGEVLMFGGLANGAFRSDSWVYGYSSAAAEYCWTGRDTDSDGLAGCADPDCGATCVACGDGLCAPVESCHLCPGDCTCTALCGDGFCDSPETAASCPGDC